jgi:hypothetical protein
MRDCSFPSTSDSARPAAAILRGAAALALASALVISGCAGSSGAIPAPTAKNVEYAGRNGQVTTLSALKVGRKLYISRCSSCHGLKAPESLTPQDWPEMVERMASNAKVNPDQQRAITQYLVSVSAAARDTSAVPTAARPAPDAASK